jgi:hypothetical protein
MAVSFIYEGGTTFSIAYGLPADSPDRAAQLAGDMGATHVLYGEGIYTALTKYNQTTRRICRIQDLSTQLTKELRIAGWL